MPDWEAVSRAATAIANAVRLFTHALSRLNKPVEFVAKGFTWGIVFLIAAPLVAGILLGSVGVMALIIKTLAREETHDHRRNQQRPPPDSGAI